MKNKELDYAVPSANRFPTSKRDYTLVTPMMIDAYDIVVGEVDKMNTGICFYSNSRFGKSKTVDYILKRFKNEMSSVTVVRMNMVTGDHFNDKKFFALLFRAITDEEDPLDKGRDICSQIETFLIRKCAEKRDPRVLIFIDEAQRLEPKHYSYLIDLTNNLEIMGIDSTVVLIGQPELISMRSKLSRLKRQDVIGRFMDVQIEFEGVLSEDVLANILRQYDDFTFAEFPPNSGRCISEAYVGKLFTQGFRLQNCSAALWSAMCTSAGALNIPTSIGMKGLARVIEMGLTELAISGAVGEANISDKWWGELLNAAGYSVHLKTLSEYSNAA